ncbi:MAG: NusG domain II-containing protein [Clostridiales bacterium]|nr:NusG domain II-containing protein [Clostridiales bacterium]
MNLENVKKVKRSKAFTVLDIVLAVVIAAAIGISAWLIYRKPALTVTVTAPNYERVFPLDEDRTVALDHLTVHIENGRVWVSDADCADRVCERTGVISRGGQSIVCLPHGVVVRIGGESDLQWELGR